MDSISHNWIFHFEFKVTSDTLAPLFSNMIEVSGDEGIMVRINVQIGNTFDIGTIMFQPTKNVYHKVVYTQVYSPIHNACLKQVRIDGGKWMRTFERTPQSYTNVKAYAGSPGAPSQTQNVLIRNFFLLDLDRVD